MAVEPAIRVATPGEQRLRAGPRPSAITTGRPRRVPRAAQARTGYTARPSVARTHVDSRTRFHYDARASSVLRPVEEVRRAAWNALVIIATASWAYTVHGCMFPLDPGHLLPHATLADAARTHAVRACSGRGAKPGRPGIARVRPTSRARPEKPRAAATAGRADSQDSLAGVATLARHAGPAGESAARPHSVDRRGRRPPGASFV